MNIKSPVTEQATVLNYVPSGSGLQKITDKWGKFPFAVVRKRIALMDSSPTFRELEAIFLHAALKPLMHNFALHHSYVALSSSNSNPCGQYFLKSFTLVIEIPEIWRKKKGISIVLK